MAGRIAGITVEIGGDTTKLQTALKGVDGQLRQTQSALKDINKLLKLDPGNTELLTQKQKNLEKAINETKDRLKQLKDAQSQVQEGTAEWDALQREIIATEQQLEQLEREYRNFGSVAAQQIAAVGEKMKALGEKMSKVGETLTKYVTLPIAAAGAKAVASFAEVDKTMQLANKTMNNSAEEAKMLDKAMSDAAAQSTFGMEDAAQAALNFARAGLTAEQSADTLAPAMNLAAGQAGDLDTVSQGLVATINGFQDSFDNAEQYADVFSATCNNSALEIDSLISSMSTAAPVFNAAGYTINDLALYMGIMANNGVEASEGANALKTGLSRLVSPAKEGQVWLDKFKWSITDANGDMKDTVTIQRELHDAFANLSEAEQISAASAIFGKNQMAKWLALINTAPEEVEKLSNSIDKSKGTTKEMADAMMGGFGGSIEKLKSSLDVLMTKLGELLSTRIQPIINKIQEWVDKFNSLDEGTQNTIVTIGLVVAAIGPLLLIGGKLITGIGMLLAFAPFVVSAFSVLIGPVGLVIAAIAALIAIGVALYKNWDEIKAKAAETWENIKLGWETFKTNISESFRAFGEAARQSFIDTWENIKTATTNAWNGVKDAISSKVDEIKNKISSSFEAAKNKVQSVIDRIRGIINGANWRLPHLAIPHLSVWGTFSLRPPSVPHFSIAWHKRAYDNPMMFTSPTVLQTPQGPKGFGDGNGAEIVLGLNKLRELVGGAGDNITINVYASDNMNVNQLADQIQQRLVQLSRQKEAAYA